MKIGNNLLVEGWNLLKYRYRKGLNPVNTALNEYNKLMHNLPQLLHHSSPPPEDLFYCIMYKIEQQNI